MNAVSCEFGTIIEAPDEALDWLEEKLGLNSELDDSSWNDQSIMTSRDEGPLLVSSFDGCKSTKIGFLIEAVSEMQIKFNLDEPWHLTWTNFWAEDSQWYLCGEAVVCYRGMAIRMMSPLEWINETEAKLTRDLTPNA